MPQTLNTQVTADTVITTTVETVVATLSGVSTPRSGVKVVLAGMCQVTSGGSTTALTPRIRRGTDATGVLVGEGNPLPLATAAGSTEELAIQCEDTPGEVAGQSYVLTVQQTGAIANGSAIYADITATVVY